ncbi:hypothetical protein AKJ16_DCAP04163 [Drosera capensis]
MSSGGGATTMQVALSTLFNLQSSILNRISKLELTHFPQLLSSAADSTETDSATVERLSAILCGGEVSDFVFKRVPSDYYDRSLEERRGLLGAASTNTQAQSHVIDCTNPRNSKYYVVVVQYTARFNAEMVKNFLYSINGGEVPKKKFNLRLAPEETSATLTGYEHNAVTCIGMKTEIPVILDEAIVNLSPDFFWLGGGEVDLKMGIRTTEFIDFVKPFIVKCTS